MPRRPRRTRSYGLLGYSGGAADDVGSRYKDASRKEERRIAENSIARLEESPHIRQLILRLLDEEFDHDGVVAAEFEKLDTLINMTGEREVEAGAWASGATQLPGRRGLINFPGDPDGKNFVEAADIFPLSRGNSCWFNSLMQGMFLHTPSILKQFRENIKTENGFRAGGFDSRAFSGKLDQPNLAGPWVNGAKGAMSFQTGGESGAFARGAYRAITMSIGPDGEPVVEKQEEQGAIVVS